MKGPGQLFGVIHKLLPRPLGVMLGAGYTEILSPEWTPVRSICSMIPGIRMSVAVAYGIDLDLLADNVFVDEDRMILRDLVDDADELVNIVRR